MRWAKNIGKLLSLNFGMPDADFIISYRKKDKNSKKKKIYLKTLDDPKLNGLGLKSNEFLIIDDKKHVWEKKYHKQLLQIPPYACQEIKESITLEYMINIKKERGDEFDFYLGLISEDLLCYEYKLRYELEEKKEKDKKLKLERRKKEKKLKKISQSGRTNETKKLKKNKLRKDKKKIKKNKLNNKPPPPPPNGYISECESVEEEEDEELTTQYILNNYDKFKDMDLDFGIPI